MSFNGQIARIEQELRRRGRNKTPVVYFNDPEADLDEIDCRIWWWTSFARSSLDGRGASARARKHGGLDRAAHPRSPRGFAV